MSALLRTAVLVSCCSLANGFSTPDNQVHSGEQSDIPTWLSDRLLAFDLKADTFESTGRGLQTLRDRNHGDLLLSVSESAAVTASSLIQQFPNIFQPAIQASIEKYQKSFTEEQVMALGLLILRDKDDPYVQSLPIQQFSVLTMPQEIFSCFPSTYQRLIQAYEQYTQGLHEKLIGSLEGVDSKTLKLAQSPKDFLWAFATVRSRCLAVSDDDIVGTSANGEAFASNKDGSRRVMLPGFDLFNHRFGAKGNSDFKDGHYVFHSHDTYKKGEQVFISYSSENGRDNLNMFMTYGFCPTDNPESMLCFDNQNLLEACASARPAYFNAQVLQQLEELLAKLGKNKELYVFDGSAKKAQSSLINGIAMMEDIEKQFLPPSQPQDPDFANDVLQALLFVRQQELERGLGLCGSMNWSSENASWQPIVQSIQTLLSIELENVSSPTANSICET